MGTRSFPLELMNFHEKWEGEKERERERERDRERITVSARGRMPAEAAVPACTQVRRGWLTTVTVSCVGPNSSYSVGMPA